MIRILTIIMCLATINANALILFQPKTKAKSSEVNANFQELKNEITNINGVSLNAINTFTNTNTFDSGTIFIGNVYHQNQIGVGESVPIHELDILRLNDIRINMQTSNSLVPNMFINLDGQGGSIDLSNLGSGDNFRIIVEGSSAIYIDDNRNIGIDTVPNSQKLFVNGNVQADTFIGLVFIGDGSQLTGIIADTTGFVLEGSNISLLVNDSGFLTTETQVTDTAAWNKIPNKVTDTATFSKVIGDTITATEVNNLLNALDTVTVIDTTIFLLNSTDTLTGTLNVTTEVIVPSLTSDIANLGTLMFDTAFATQTATGVSFSDIESFSLTNISPSAIYLNVTTDTVSSFKTEVKIRPPSLNILQNSEIRLTSENGTSSIRMGNFVTTVLDISADSVGGYIEVTGDIKADSFIGDGSLLTNLPTSDTSGLLLNVTDTLTGYFSVTGDIYGDTIYGIGLQIRADQDLESNIGHATILSENDSAQFSHRDRTSSTDYAIKQYQDGTTWVNVRVGKNLHFAQSGISRMVLDGSAFVGINSTTPTQRLDVGGNVKADSFIGDIHYSSVQQHPFIPDTSTLEAQIAQINQWDTISVDSAYTTFLRTVDTSIFLLNTTDSLTGNLSVSGTIDATNLSSDQLRTHAMGASSGYLIDNAQAGAGSYNLIEVDGTAGGYTGNGLEVNVSATANAIITSGGNVGIDTASPVSELAVTGSVTISETIVTNLGASIAKNTDQTVFMGRARFGATVTDVMYLSHHDRPSAADYALKQDAGGQTQLNTRGGKTLILSRGNSPLLTFQTDTRTMLGAGTATHKFEINGDLKADSANLQIIVTDTITSKSDTIVVLKGLQIGTGTVHISANGDMYADNFYGNGENITGIVKRMIIPLMHNQSSWTNTTETPSTSNKVEEDFDLDINALDIDTTLIATDKDDSVVVYVKWNQNPGDATDSVWGQARIRADGVTYEAPVVESQGANQDYHITQKIHLPLSALNFIEWVHIQVAESGAGSKSGDLTHVHLSIKTRQDW